MNLQEIATYTQQIIAQDHTEQLDIIKMLVKSVRHVVQNGVEGSIAEFGTMTGRTAITLALASNYYFQKYKKNDVRHKIEQERKLHLFDSFQGLPEAQSIIDDQSLHVKSGIWAKGTCQGLSREQLGDLIRALKVDHFTQIYAGWFSDTVKSLDETVKYAVIHVDCDLYQSTMDALTPLFSQKKVAKGGIILFDDYNCNRADNYYGERKAWKDLIDLYKIKYEILNFYGVSGMRLVVHDYDFESN